MKTTWVSPKPQFSPAMAPTYAPQQQREPLYSHDKHFALHGEILMLVLVGIFSIFLLSLLLIPCLKQNRNPDDQPGDDEVSAMQRNSEIKGGERDGIGLRASRAVATENYSTRIPFYEWQLRSVGLAV
ncbi:hypothetical protein SADUNF_Sadunf16G0164000 [Salix dunnii]|uniref:Uncharacterized protein n=1 Tax=Salix dunnii TaxID=1413687 RepID=A0A835JBI1_9ROSI|nr:hypothetical protein SADUNF_Sadunf16G0164000 [Salix dunnii]